MVKLLIIGAWGLVAELTAKQPLDRCCPSCVGAGWPPQRIQEF